MLIFLLPRPPSLFSRHMPPLAIHASFFFFAAFIRLRVDIACFYLYVCLSWWHILISLLSLDFTGYFFSCYASCLLSSSRHAAAGALRDDMPRCCASMILRRRVARRHARRWCYCCVFLSDIFFFVIISLSSFIAADCADNILIFLRFLLSSCSSHGSSESPFIFSMPPYYCHEMLLFIFSFHILSLSYYTLFSLLSTDRYFFFLICRFSPFSAYHDIFLAVARALAHAVRADVMPGCGAARCGARYAMPRAARQYVCCCQARRHKRAVYDSLFSIILIYKDFLSARGVRTLYLWFLDDAIISLTWWLPHYADAL